MAGNSVYGAGYHQGSRDGFQEGLSKGTGLGAAGVLALAGTAVAGKLVIDKLKVVAAARHEKRLLAMDHLNSPSENVSAKGRSDGMSS